MEDFIKQIEAALNAIIAEQRAHQLVLLGLIGQIAGEANDWRERLRVMREVAERGIKGFEITTGDEASKAELRKDMAAHITQLYDEVGRSLSQWEASGRPNPYPKA
ncbi:hypothetical protein [Mesorhizobium sp. M4B.F.Ca.ET.017.02.2.1]|uniref:hypothetical protein n=1 Tax=Mesorhizobium sp. M4B.F.Ca.ET.017.02.2.1 TaxID=2496649 RepID=UPI000FCBD865|nr:hypothetical protein [Mesorhizobium sp. M4B.F.Ca.ET.017.02.2.1]RVD31434.1 hypothetical protein EN738_01905 [Mesorhizobium sp. M4B.F.Ca.ET.017.02.2.1]